MTDNLENQQQPIDLSPTPAPKRKYTRYSNDQERLMARRAQKKRWQDANFKKRPTFYMKQKMRLSAEEFEAWKSEQNKRRRQLSAEKKLRKA